VPPDTSTTQMQEVVEVLGEGGGQELTSRMAVATEACGGRWENVWTVPLQHNDSGKGQMIQVSVLTDSMSHQRVREECWYLALAYGFVGLRSWRMEILLP